MDITLPDIALIAAGVIGGVVAVIHGVLTQRFMVKPVDRLLLADKRTSAPIRRLVAALLQFSTFNWFLSGLALIAAAFWLEPQARLAVGVLVGSSYLYGGLGNLWATRARHPGGWLYVAAVVLIVVGLI